VVERGWWFRTALVVVVFSAIIYLIGALGRFWGFLGDLLLIFFLAWLVGSVLIHVVNSLMRIPHMNRTAAIILVYLALLTLIADFALLVIPATVTQVKDLADNVPDYVERLPDYLQNIDASLAGFGIRSDLQGQIQIESVTDLANSLTVSIDNAVQIAQNIFSALFKVSLVIAISFYVVLDGGRRLNEALKVLPPKAERETRYVLRTIDETFHGYVRGMLLISMIYGVGTASIMIGMDLPAALPVAIISSLLLAVPFLGDWLALLLPTVIAYTAGGFLTMVVVLGTLLFVQQVMLNLLTPRILGHAVRMPAMLVIIAVVVGARLAGISGALLGVPTVGVLYRIATHYGMMVRERREARESAERDANALATGPSADEASTAEGEAIPEGEVDSDKEPAPIAGGAPEGEDSEQPER
jgi:predicted PurR-regulated permease PerM